MNDDTPARDGLGRSLRRDLVLRRARQHIQQIEIETHRVKSDLARLESDNETNIADELTDELSAAVTPEAEFEPRPHFASPPGAARLRVDLSPQRTPPRQATSAPRITVDGNGSAPIQAAGRRHGSRRRKKSSPAWLASLAVHVALLALIAPVTFVLLTNEEPPLLASIFDPDAARSDESEAVPVELLSAEPFELPGEDVEPAAALVDSVADELVPSDADWSGELSPALGQLNSLPTDLGMLMSGGSAASGQPLGGGRRGAAGDEARLGMTRFFGTEARANRVVFLVDNSASMKQGRMETTLFELARSVEALSEKQEFYVVFYSDQAYPMLYPNSVMEPLAATRENKQRLYEWLDTVELCIGGALLKAVELAESLQPDVVYVLSDGDITGRATMQRLVEPNGRKFAIHTLGMGVKKPQDAQNLAAIARANHGTFQMVRPLPAAVQRAKTRPIRSNSAGVAWGESFTAAGNPPLVGFGR